VCHAVGGIARLAPVAAHAATTIIIVPIPVSKAVSPDRWAWLAATVHVARVMVHWSLVGTRLAPGAAPAGSAAHLLPVDAAEPLRGCDAASGLFCPNVPRTVWQRHFMYGVGGILRAFRPCPALHTHAAVAAHLPAGDPCGVHENAWWLDRHGSAPHLVGGIPDADGAGMHITEEQPVCGHAAAATVHGADSVFGPNRSARVAAIVRSNSLARQGLARLAPPGAPGTSSLSTLPATPTHCCGPAAPPSHAANACTRPDCAHFAGCPHCGLRAVACLAHMAAAMELHRLRDVLAQEVARTVAVVPLGAGGGAPLAPAGRLACVGTTCAPVTRPEFLVARLFRQAPLDVPAVA
jgi:hypothetical protein